MLDVEAGDDAAGQERIADVDQPLPELVEVLQKRHLAGGIVADRIGERRVIAAGQVGAAAALVWAARTSSYGALVAALSVTGALGAGVNAASGRAVMGGSANTSEGWLWGYGRWASHWAGPSPPARSRR